MKLVHPAFAGNPHVPKLLKALDRAEKSLDKAEPIIESVSVGAPKRVHQAAPRLRNAGIDLSVASTHAARAGLEELMRDLTGAASALVGVSELAQLRDGATTFTPDVAPEIVGRATGLHANVDAMIADIRAYVDNGGAPPEPPADAPPPDDAAGDAPPAAPPGDAPPAAPSGDAPPAAPSGDAPPADAPDDAPPPTAGGGAAAPSNGNPTSSDLIGGPVPAREPGRQWAEPPAMTIDPDGRYVAQLATTDGVIGVELLPKVAPNAVNNFVFLAREGFYDKVPIHRTIPGFMMQSGDPTGTGMGGPGYDIPDDPVPPDMKYEKGVLAMANTGQPNTGGSQFFIMHGDVPLPPTYTIFGRVTEGVDVLDRIAARPVVDNGQGEVSRPVDPIGIHGVTVDGP